MGRIPAIFRGPSKPTPHLLSRLRTIRAVTHPMTDVLAVTSGCATRQISRAAQISTRTVPLPRHVRPRTHVAIFTKVTQRPFIVHTGASGDETFVASLRVHDATRSARAFRARPTAETSAAIVELARLPRRLRDASSGRHGSTM